MSETQGVKQELTVVQKNFNTVRQMIDGRLSEIKSTLPKHIRPDHFLRVYINSIQRNPALLECTPISLLGALLLCAQFGLEPDGLTRQAYLIPFNNGKTGNKEVQVIVGYGGLIDMARRSGQITGVEARVVSEKDDFKYSFGLNPTLDHVPYTKGDAGKPVAFYAIGRFLGGHSQFDVMSKEDVDKIRGRSKAAGAGPWVTDYNEMAKKTVVRRLCKLLPSAVELQRIISIDERGDLGLAQDLALIADPDAKSTDEVVADAQDLMPERASEAQTPAKSIVEGASKHEITDKTGMKVISSKFPNKCSDCRGDIPKGSMIYYHPETHAAYHHANCPA